MTAPAGQRRDRAAGARAGGRAGARDGGRARSWRLLAWNSDRQLVHDTVEPSDSALNATLAVVEARADVATWRVNPA
ncbi:hypothetical protein [Nocardioides bruguierae]|uniref:Uncharacterized protein n=1 Tax=Nocardioides bruguierae TaxID=2945102 RepID=A0A9X2DA74_9ACTN|nr:hypothetical protein [Nocardioides bruguierae]MCM0622198.1 hypothetical protein [Nocardioides bruguierae]